MRGLKDLVNLIIEFSNGYRSFLSTFVTYNFFSFFCRFIIFIFLLRSRFIILFIRIVLIISFIPIRFSKEFSFLLLGLF